MMSDEWKIRLKVVGIVGQGKEDKGQKRAATGERETCSYFGFLYLLCLYWLPNLPLGDRSQVENNRNSNEYESAFGRAHE
jgi:hypothetical protein